MQKRWSLEQTQNGPASPHSTLAQELRPRPLARALARRATQAKLSTEAPASPKSRSRASTWTR
eukprot:4593001-Alexandrium_andersonii.AAC.1